MNRPRLAFALSLLTVSLGCIPRNQAGSDGHDLKTLHARPLEIVRAYAESWRDGDGRRFLSLVHVEDGRRRPAAEAFARIITNAPKLRRAAADRFGAVNAHRVVQVIPIPPTDSSGAEMIGYLDDPDEEEDVEIEGERATVEIGSVRLELQELSGRWKVLFPRPGLDHEEEVKTYRKVIAYQQQLIEELRAGRYATAEDVLRAYYGNTYDPTPR